jgi:hypothetical protein
VNLLQPGLDDGRLVSHPAGNRGFLIQFLNADRAAGLCGSGKECMPVRPVAPGEASPNLSLAASVQPGLAALPHSQARGLHLARKAELLEEKNPIVIDIDFIPGQPVTGRYGMRMMVVVPSFPARQQRHPEIVSRVVSR